MNDNAPEPRVDPRARRKESRRRRILRSTAALPALCTLLNGLSGFGAIHFATKEALGSTTPQHLHNLVTACWLIFLAMAFDVLDGRLARMTRRTSDFGAQLDSLCDAVSFGLAPAVLMLRFVIPLLRDDFAFFDDNLLVERAVWCVAGVYMSCAIIRLARFNVENEPDESAHMNFRGLPSPGAAAMVAAMVMLFVRLHSDRFASSGVATTAMACILPAVTLAAALLMTSRLKYPHLINQLIRGKRPIAYLLKLLAVGVPAVIVPWWTLVVATVGYGFSAPVLALWRKTRLSKSAPPPAGS